MATPKCIQLIVCDDTVTPTIERKIYLPVHIDFPAQYYVSMSALPLDIQIIIHSVDMNFYKLWERLNELALRKCKTNCTSAMKNLEVMKIIGSILNIAMK